MALTFDARGHKQAFLRLPRKRQDRYFVYISIATRWCNELHRCPEIVLVKWLHMIIAAIAAPMDIASRNQHLPMTHELATKRYK